MSIDLTKQRQRFESAMNVSGLSELRKRALRDVFDKMAAEVKALFQRAATAEETVTFMPAKEQSLEDWRIILAACANVIESNAETLRVRISTTERGDWREFADLARETRVIAWQMQCALNHPDFPASVKPIPGIAGAPESRNPSVVSGVVKIETTEQLKADAVAHRYVPGAIVIRVDGSQEQLTSWPYFLGTGEERCAWVQARKVPGDATTNRPIRYFTVMMFAEERALDQ